MIRFSLSRDIKKNQVLGVFVFKTEKSLQWADKTRKHAQEILRKAEEDGFWGNRGDLLYSRSQVHSGPSRYLLLGAGASKEANLQLLRELAAVAARKARSSKLKTLALEIPEGIDSTPQKIQAAVEGILLGLYRFDCYKSEPVLEGFLKDVTLVVSEQITPAMKKALRQGESYASATNYARDLINEPPSFKVPETLGKRARSLSGNGISVKVYNKSELKKMKMNALLGVSRGSVHPPTLIHMHYKPKGKIKKRLALVGKGVTFDSGGLCLKTASGMLTMKYDMAGAASVLGVFKALKLLQPSVEVHGIAGVTENMPGNDAYKPGDVVKASNGKTIEIINTDAEGRVVLADALSYTSKLSVDEIVDIATLTGAATVALGSAYVAVMSNNDVVTNKLRQASQHVGEKIWELPLEPSYKSHIKSKVADIKNMGNAGEAGTIIGGLFLQEFVNEKNWAHFDIASAGWTNTGSSLSVPGANGVIVRTLLQYILDHC